MKEKGEKGEIKGEDRWGAGGKIAGKSHIEIEDDREKERKGGGKRVESRVERVGGGKRKGERGDQRGEGGRKEVKGRKARIKVK